MSVSSTGVLHTTAYGDIQANATPENNIGSGAKTIFSALLDNTDNTAVSYVKVVNATSYSVGSDVPDFCWKVPAGKKRLVTLGSAGEGINLGTGVSIAAVTTPGTAGTTSPTNPVKVRVYTS